MSRFWSPVVRTLQPYVAGEQPILNDLVKLNTNENPFGPSPRAVAAIKAEATERLRLYPDPHATQLRDALAARHGVEPDQIFVGNGSDEVLAHAFQALLKHDGPLLFPDVTYSFYPSSCLLYSIEYREIPLDAAMGVGAADYRRPCGAIILPNPNAPTGIATPLEALETLIADHPDQVVAIDEAYIDFGGQSVVPLISRYPNLLVVQTFSKSRSLAGLRVGFAIGQRPLIEALERVKDSFIPSVAWRSSEQSRRSKTRPGSQNVATASSPVASGWPPRCAISASKFCRQRPTFCSSGTRRVPARR